MADFIYLENAHIFSKAPVQLDMEASKAVNKSVHTVQCDEVWGEVCPFITTNDVSGLTKDTLFEIEGYAPVKFNYKKPVIVLDAINNNGMKSNGYVARVIINGKPVTQFIADTDVMDENGTLAAGYRAVLYDKEGGEVADSIYTINYSNGLIYFKDPIESTTESYYTLSFFTYEGKKLSSSIKDISDEINKIDTEYKAADELINEDIADLQEHASTSDIHVSTIDRENWDTVNEISDNLKVATASIKNLDDRLFVAESDISELDESVSILNSTLDSHSADNDIHVSESDRILWNKGGNLSLSGDDFITPTRNGDTWEIALNYAATISSNTAHNINGNKKVPTVNATANCINSAITIHERTKGHLNLDEYALALSGGHVANLVSPKIENTSEYSISYPSEDDVLSTTNYSGLIIRNKNVKGRNSILKKLIIEGVSQSDEETLYAHIYRFSESDIYSGNADNAAHIVSVKTNLSTPETIEIDFEEGLVIYKEYNYNITFTRTPNVSDTKIQLSYQYFSNNSETTYPVLITNDYTNGTIVADIFYVIPCTMILEDFSIPTSNAVSNVVYKDFTVNNFEEENDNFGTTYGFIIDNNVIGTLSNIKVKCVDYDKVTTTYLKILDENNIIVGCSEEPQTHGKNEELSFNFNKVTLEKDKSYKAIFSSSKTLTQLDATTGCVRVNYEGDVDFTVASLYTPVLNSNLEIILNSTTGLKSHAIVEITYKTSVADLSNIVYDSHKTHVADRVKHIFSDDYIHDDTEYNNTPLVVSSLGYGFMWKPEKSAHISSIDMVLHCSNGIFYYNPGNLENTILNAQSPVDVCLKVTDTANNKVIGTSKLIQIEPGEKNKRQSVITVPFETGEYVPCVKNKTYLITFHSSAAQETPDVALPIYPSIYEDDDIPPASDDYTIKKIIKDSNKTTYYTDGEITDKTHNSSNQTPMWPVYLEKLCVKVTTYRYTHPELEHIANAIGDIWEYLATIRNYISQS